MVKLHKKTGELILLDTQHHLSVKQVAGQLEVEPNVVWKAMRQGRLKFVMAMTPGPKKHVKQSGFIRVTLQAWVDEWRATKNDKNLQRFNGKRMYDPAKGEMSSS